MGSGVFSKPNDQSDPGCSMPFWRKDKDGGGGDSKNKEKVNYKARLEHKQYLAQESPEPFYDLSECALKTVPSGVYSRCKIARKQVLMLNDNELTSLAGGGNLADLGQLQVLDLHNNSLEKLPDEIGLLASLNTLYLQNNKLKQIPSSLGSLKTLKTLNLAGNSLKELPNSISGLTSLTSLDLRQNHKLKKIPAELARCRCLDTLLLDESTIVYPPQEIVAKGTEEIMRFLCQECDIEYLSPAQGVAQTEANVESANANGKIGSDSDPLHNMVSDHLAKAEKIKEEKRKQALLLEQQRLEAQEKEAQLKLQSDEEKKKLLNNIAMEESKKTAEVMRIQKEKEEERSRLFSNMAAAEQQTDVLINELMTSSSRYSDPKKVMEALEAERLEMEEKFTIQQHDVDRLKEKEVLRAMQMLMEEELQMEAARRQHEERRGVVQDALKSSLDNDKAVEAVLESKGKQKEALLGRLLEDEKYQKEAFQSLLLKQDHRSQEITEQMERIQNELGSLTILEMKKRDMKVEFELEVLKEKRDTLTKMLLMLMDQKKKRTEDLQDMLGTMEENRSEEQENYWLIQYQKLLDSKPQSFKEAEQNMDQRVKSLLSRIGCEKMIPIMAKQNVTFKELTYADSNQLREWGVESEYTRGQIMLAVEAEVASAGAKEQPSAPGAELDETAPSAPSLPSQTSVIDTFHSAECVVCMERKCDIIFLPCGHLCSCSFCEKDLNECPLCRGSVLQRVRLG